MPLDPNALTWTCRVCGRLRPDAAIEVYTEDVSERVRLPPGTVRINVRYCNDREACRTGAPGKVWMPRGVE